MCIESRRRIRTRSVTVLFSGDFFESLRMKFSGRSTLIYAAGEGFNSPVQHCNLMHRSQYACQIFNLRCSNWVFKLAFQLENDLSSSDAQLLFQFNTRRSRYLGKRFCRMFSESSTDVLQLPCCPRQARGELSGYCLQNLLPKQRPVLVLTRESLKGLYVVARNFLLLCLALPGSCLAKDTSLLVHHCRFQKVFGDMKWDC